MEYLDLTFASSAHNLALDEALLDEADRGECEGTLRFWESAGQFVALGYGNHAKMETRPENCHKDQIPTFRRCSGGGTVLQGPGCLNYALILPVAKFPECETIPQTNQFIMGKMREAMQALTPDRVEIKGHTDLCLGKLKFSGNAQRRKKNTVLFHGTLLYRFDLSKIERYLGSPSREPDYREGRTHLDFVMNFPSNRLELQKSVRNRWGAQEIRFLEGPVYDQTRILALEKYSTRQWNEKF